MLEGLSGRLDVADVELLPNGEYAAAEPTERLAVEEVLDDGTPYVPDPVVPKQEPTDTFNGVTVAPNHGTVEADTQDSSDAPVDIIVIDDEEPMVS